MKIKRVNEGYRRAPALAVGYELDAAGTADCHEIAVGAVTQTLSARPSAR